MATAAAPQVPTTALARQKVAAILTSEDARKQIAPLLKPGVSLERVVSTIYQVVADNPEILDCTPASIVMAVGKGVQQDLEFGETIHLVPFNVKVSKKGERDRWEKRAKAVRDYKGDVELVRRSGAARAVGAQCFYEHEPFVYRQGTHPYVEHHPIVDRTKRGKLLGAYAYAVVSQRSPLHVVVMSVDEIDKIRHDKSKSYKDGPLEDYAPWYPVKTVIHQLVKLLPKNERLRQLDREFDREDNEIPEAEYEVVSTTATAGPSPQSAAGTSETPSQGQQEAATSAPAAATSNDETPSLEEQEPDPAGMTLEQAKTMKLFGKPEAWGGKAGELLDTFSSGHLQQIKKWCVERIEENGDDPLKQSTVTAINLLLADRAKDQTQLPLSTGGAK